MRILIARGDGLVLAGVRQALAGDGGFDVVGEVHDGSTLAARTAELRPTVVLLDIDIPGGGGIECLKELRTAAPEVKVVMCSMLSDCALREESFRAGACGYILERINATDLAAAIRQAVACGGSLPSHLLAHGNDDGHAAARRLTEREEDVLSAVALGLSNKAIAAELAVTVPTVKFHLTSIFRKLGVTNRTEAARWALRHGSAH